MTRDSGSLAAALRRRLTAAQHAAGATGTGSAPPRLTAMQREMWLGETLGTVGSAYTLLRAWRLRGPLDLAALDAAIGQVIARHDAFALRIVKQDGEPRPVFGPAPVWRGVEAELPQGDDPEAWLQTRLSDLGARRFQLDQGPLFAVHLLMMAPGDAVLVWVQHHIIADDWSFSVIARDLGHFYARYLGEDAAPLPDTGAGLQGSLAAPPAVPETADAPQAPAPGGQPGSEVAWPVTGLERTVPDDPARAGTTFGTLTAAELEALTSTARSLKVSLYALVAAVYLSLLTRFCDDRSMSIGVSRTLRLTVEDEAKVGMFVDHVLLAADAAPDMTLADLARDLAQSLRDKPRSAFGPANGGTSGASFVLYSLGTVEINLAGIDCATCDQRERGLPVDLHLGVYPVASGAKVLLAGRLARFSADALDRLLATFCLQLRAIGTADPEQLRLWDLPLFPTQEALFRMQDQAEQDGSYPDTESIAQRFCALATQMGDAPALATPHVRWSYADLAREADAIAGWLMAQGLSPGDVVGLALPRGAGLIRATLGALQAGLVLAPIDPAYPRQRRDDMAAIAGCRLVLTGEAVDDPDPAEAPPGMCLPPPVGAGAAPDPVVPVPVAPDGIAYIIFTSGSTGRPKGVATTHRAIQRLAAGLGTARPGPGDRLPLIASPSFDGCFIEIYGALLNGAELVSPEGEPGDHRDLADLFVRQRVTMGFVTTGLFNLILDSVPKAFASFRWLAVGGETMSPHHAMRFLRDYPKVDLLNAYGPTENGALTTQHRVRPSDAKNVPIGKPMPGNIALVLGMDGTPMPPGFAGQLWVGGPGLAREYVGLPDQTAAVFRDMPRHRLGLAGAGTVRLYATGDRAVRREDGRLCHNGRRDAQVKLSGHRIELSEIEAAIRRVKGVQDAMVIPRRPAPGAAVTAIHAGVVGDADLFDGNGAALRRALRQDLPRIMIPSRFCRVPALPLTPNGKRDAQALARVIDSAAPELPADVAPAGAEADLAAIWTEFVAPPDAGRASDFFASGGQSLRAMQMLAEIENRFQQRIPISDFFDNPTLGGLQDLLQHQGHGAPMRHLVLMRDGNRDKPPLIAVTGLRGASLWARNMIDALPGSHGAIYGLNLAADDRLAENVPSLSRLAQDMVDEILTEFPDTPVRLFGYSFAGFFAFVLASELERRGHPVDRLILIDPNTNLGAARPAPAERRDPTEARLNALRSAHRLGPISGGIDFVFCTHSFPYPRFPDAEEWAVLAGGGLRLYRIRTSHYAVIYGAWAKVLAATVSGLLDGTRSPDTTYDMALPAGDIDRLYAASAALAAGRPGSAAADCADLLQRFTPAPTFLRVLHLGLVATAQDRRTVRKIARTELSRRAPDPAFLFAMMPVLRKLGETRLAARVKRRLFHSSGPDVHGALDLVAEALMRRRPLLARWYAYLASRRGRTPLVALICQALIARVGGDRGKAYDLVLQAVGRSDVGVEHFEAILDRILRPQDHAFALAMISAADEQFPGTRVFDVQRQKWGAISAGLAAGKLEGQPVQ